MRITTLLKQLHGYNILKRNDLRFCIFNCMTVSLNKLKYMVKESETTAR